MTKPEMEKAFLEAAEIAKKLPKNLQEIGFTRALDEILGKRGSRNEGQSGNAKKGHPARSSKPSGGEEGDTGATDELIESIDRTSHPDLAATNRVADRALKVLDLAHKHHEVDGLTAGAIAAILSRKFRLPTKKSAVFMALNRETATVDVRKGSGRQKVFHIMAPGEAYLEQLRSGKETKSKRAPAKASKRKKKAKKKPADAPRAEKEGTPKRAARSKTSTSSRNTSGRPGPKAAVGQLVQAGFFRSARTIAQIQEELKHNKGHGYTVQELAPALVRSIRDESLRRDRNDEGQYEYCAT